MEYSSGAPKPSLKESDASTKKWVFLDIYDIYETVFKQKILVETSLWANIFCKQANRGFYFFNLIEMSAYDVSAT